MVAFKILTLALATAVAASVSYVSPPAVSSAVLPAITIVTSTVTVVGKAPSGPDPTSPIAVASSVIILTPTVAPSSSSDIVNLSSELSLGGNNLTSTEVPIQISTSYPTGNLTTAVNSTLSITATASVQQPTNAAPHGKIGVAVGIVALVMGMFGA